MDLETSDSGALETRDRGCRILFSKETSISVALSGLWPWWIGSRGGARRARPWLPSVAPAALCEARSPLATFCCACGAVRIEILDRCCSIRAILDRCVRMLFWVRFVWREMNDSISAGGAVEGSQWPARFVLATGPHTHQESRALKGRQRGFNLTNCLLAFSGSHHGLGREQRQSNHQRWPSSYSIPLSFRSSRYSS
jgi:hypothetical protein